MTDGTGAGADDVTHEARHDGGTGGDARRQRRVLAGCGCLGLGVPLALLALLGVLFRCGAEPEVDVSAGHGPGRALGDLLRTYDVRLADDARELAWADLVSWDTGDLYVRMSTTPRGLRTLLRANHLAAERLQPPARDGYRRALPRDDWSRGSAQRSWSRPELAPSLLAWHQTSRAGARVLTHRRREPRGYVVLVLLVERPVAGRQQVFLHASQ